MFLWKCSSIAPFRQMTAGNKENFREKLRRFAFGNDAIYLIFWYSFATTIL
jgi:hypothetical protein